jgi:hypothetical protein
VRRPAILLAALGAVAWAVPGPARAEPPPQVDGEASAEAEREVEATAELHLRATGRRNDPRTDVRLDAASVAFDVAGYLRPSSDDRYLATFVALGLDGRRGDWRWSVQADSGEVRRASFPRALAVCGSLSSPTGLALTPTASCSSAGGGGPWIVPGVADGPPELTANYRPAGEEARGSWFLREAWVGTSAGRNGFAFLRAGRHRFTVGDGFVYDDHGLGLEARLDLGALGPPWDLGAALFWPSRDWPRGTDLGSFVLALRADRMLSLFDHVGVFAAWAHDAAGDVADLFRGAEIEDAVLQLRGSSPGDAAYASTSRRLAGLLGREQSGSADLAFAGLSGNLAVARGHRLAFTAALSTGRIRFPAPTSATGTVLGGMASASWEGRVADPLLLGTRFLWISGDVPPGERIRLGLSRQYGGFLGVSPWVTATNLFFAGGLNETFSSRQASAPGVNGRGVYGPIAFVAWQPSERLRAELRGAFLAAPETGPFGGRVYGPEADLNLRWSPVRWLALSLEADALWPGDFYGGGSTVRKVVAAMDLVTP